MPHGVLADTLRHHLIQEILVVLHQADVERNPEN